MQETQIWSLGKDHHLEEEMATHATITVWRIPGTEEPGGLQSTGSQRVGHDWATELNWKKTMEKEMATHSWRGGESCLENPVDGGAW